MFEYKTVIDIAIIIPTLNEEHFIGRLLDVAPAVGVNLAVVVISQGHRSGVRSQADGVIDPGADFYDVGP